jgi:peptidoglycan/xylan/chitin deacetylase (PgdA/CDA1 family)
MKRFLIILLVLMLVLNIGITGCSAPARLVSVTPKGEPVPPIDAVIPTASFTPFQPIKPTYTPSFTITATPLPTWTHTPTPTLTPSPTQTATWVFNEAGKVIAPILLYHHIANITPASRYYVSPTDFRIQMQALKDWGFTTITPSYLREVLVNGGNLPYRPVLITFDDGNLDVYENAFPIMRDLGFTGACYLVSTRLKADGYMSVDQLKEMIAAGWEIGSHTANHYDLTLNHGLVRDEMLQSRLDIQEALSVTVTSIAYPYGLVDEYIATQAQEYGYFTGMGLGILTEHTWSTLYYLNRREVHGDMDLPAFASLLPWSGITPTTTPTP